MGKRRESSGTSRQKLTNSLAGQRTAHGTGLVSKRAVLLSTDPSSTTGMTPDAGSRDGLSAWLCPLPTSTPTHLSEHQDYSQSTVRCKVFNKSLLHLLKQIYYILKK